MSNSIRHKQIFGIRKSYAIVLSFFFFILIGTGYLLLNTERIINKNLSNFVYEKSDSIYRLNFESFEFNLIKHKMKITGITFVPDPLAETDSLRRYYQLFTPSISIENISYLELIRNRRFVAEKFKIEAPKFLLSTGDQVRIQQFSESGSKIGDKLNLPVFTEIVFDTLLVVDARLNIDSIFLEKYELPKVNLEVLNFKIGGTKKTATPFPFDVDDLSLKIENILDELSDSLHIYSVEQVNLSLMYSTIKAKKITLAPKPGITNSHENLYNVEVPEIVLRSRDAVNFYLIDTISIDSMVMKDPKINIKFGSKVENGTPPNEINLHKLFEDRWRWIQINKLSIKNGDVKFTANKETKESQHFENLNIDFFNFKIDSSSYRDKDRILSAKDMLLSLSTFTLFHTDKVHVFTIESLNADTRTNELTSGAVKFQPIKGSNKGKVSTLMDIKSTGLIFKEFDFKEFYHHQIIPMKEMIIQSPTAKIEFEQPLKVQKDKRDKSIILEKTRDYLTGIYVETAKIKNGKVEYNYSNIDDKNGFFKTNFDFELKKLSIDSVTFYQSDKIFFARDFNISFSDINLQLADKRHQLLTKSMSLSSKDQSAEIIDFKIEPILLPDSVKKVEPELEKFNIHFPRVHMVGANLHQAFFEKQLTIDQFSISNPTLSIELTDNIKTRETPAKPYQTTLYSLIDEFLFNLKIGTLNMEDGIFHLIQHKHNEPDFSMSNAFSIKMSNFELNENAATRKDKLFFSDNIDLVLKKHELKLADGVHKLSADEIGILSSKGEIYIKKAYLYPDVLSNSFKNLPISVFANIPEMRIANANILELINEGKFDVNTISFNRPNIKLLFQKTETKGKPESAKKPNLLLDGIKSFSTNKIIINQGLLELASYSDSKTKTFSNTEIGFEMNNFKILLANNDFKTSYSGYEIWLSNFNFQLPDQIHQLSVEKIRYNLSSKTLGIINLILKPKKDIVKNNEKQYFDLAFPMVTLTGFDPEELIRNKNLFAQTLLLEAPTIKVDNKQIEKQDPFNPYKIDLYSSLQQTIKNIKISEVALKNGNLEVNGKKPFKLYNFNLNTQNFSIDESNIKGNKLFFSEHFVLKTDELKGKTKGGYYKYTIKSCTLDEKGNFNIDKISLKPVFSQKEFVQLKKYQSDYYDIENLDISGQGMNLRSYFEKNQYSIPRVDAKFHNVKINRDRTVPIDPNSRKKLPQQALRNWKQKIDIGLLVISCDNFDYTEDLPTSVDPNRINSTNIEAEISNITNINEEMAINPNIKASIDGKLMGVGDTHIEMDLNIPSLNNKFTFKAECGPMPLTIFNPTTEPGLKLSIKDGYNKRLEVFFEANEDSAQGNMRFMYNDLKVSLLSTRRGEIHEDKLASFFANTMVKSDNPKAGKFLIPVKIKSQRDQRAIIGYCWRTILSGLKASLGLKEKENEKIEKEEEN